MVRRVAPEGAPIRPAGPVYPSGCWPPRCASATIARPCSPTPRIH